ncbi:MAG: hypothetical protein WCD87_24895, partial [Pseudolabrys sp.]
MSAFDPKRTSSGATGSFIIFSTALEPLSLPPISQRFLTGLGLVILAVGIGRPLFLSSYSPLR